METVQRIVIVTVMGKALEPRGEASEELVDRCRTAAMVMGELEGALVITGGTALKMEIQMESVASMMRNWSYLAKTAVSDTRYGVRNELQRAGITLSDDFKFENIDEVLEETLSVWKN